MKNEIEKNFKEYMKKNIKTVGELFEFGLFQLKKFIKDDRHKSVELYCSLCNTQWQSVVHSDLIYSCSWRYAGGLIANIRGVSEDYLDYYCSGCEGTVAEWVEEEMNKLGWKSCQEKEDEKDYKKEIQELRKISSHYNEIGESTTEQKLSGEKIVEKEKWEEKAK